MCEILKNGCLLFLLVCLFKWFISFFICGLVFCLHVCLCEGVGSLGTEVIQEEEEEKEEEEKEKEEAEQEKEDLEVKGDQGKEEVHERQSEDMENGKDDLGMVGPGSLKKELDGRVETRTEMAGPGVDEGGVE